MDIDTTDIWGRLAATLRSGRYTHGRGQLRHRDGSYCVLGVLCDMIDPCGWSETPNEAGDHEWLNGVTWGLPSDVATLLGCSEDGPLIELGHSQR